MDLPKIDFGSVSKFYLSLGTFFLFAAAFILVYSVKTYSVISINLLTSAYEIFALLGAMALGYGIYRLFKDSSKEDSYKLEIKINNVLDQDLKFMELKIKALEYNSMIHEYNKKYDASLPTIEHRNFDSIAKQAMCDDFYAKTYPDVKFHKIKRK